MKRIVYWIVVLIMIGIVLLGQRMGFSGDEAPASPRRLSDLFASEDDALISRIP